MKKLRLAVIGAGSWTVASHLPNLLQRAGDVEFVGVCRKGPQLLERIKTDWGFRVASEDYREVLDSGADIAVVASPSAAHYEHALAALNAGAHVLVEKPFTLSSAEAWHLVDVALAKKRHIVVSFGFNYRPLMVEATSLLREIGIGEIESQSIYMSSVTRDLLANRSAYPKASADTMPDSQTWTDPVLSGGGYAQAQLSHALGVALSLSGLVGEEVFAAMSAPHGESVEIYDAMTVRYRNGAIGVIGGASGHEGALDGRDQLQVRLIGSEGQAEVRFEDDRVSLYHRDRGNVERVLPPGSGTYDCDGPLHALVDLALGKDVENRSPGELGARTVEILEAAYHSASMNSPVKVEVRQ